MRRSWATLCGSYVIASTVGGLAKTVIGPSGEPIIGDGHPLRTFAVKVNTNFRVLHGDFNKDALTTALAKYGTRIEVRYPGPLGLMTFLSNDATLPVDEVISKCGIETWTRYHDRSIAAREAALAVPTARSSAQTARLQTKTADVSERDKSPNSSRLLRP